MNSLGMHWLDIVILGVLGASVVAGAMTGVVKQAIRLATYVLSVHGAVYANEPLRRALGDLLQDVVPNVPRVVAGAVALPVFYLLLWVTSVRNFGRSAARMAIPR